MSWRRDRHRITAHQAGGAATWRIAGDDILTIETALGSIEATNASLRVEVNMLDNSKAIAPSAVTAAAVAAVTIVVYQGAVSIREAGQPHEVVAGATYEIKAKREDVPAPELVGASSDLATTIRELEVLIAERQIEIDKLRKTLDAYEEPTPDLEPAAIQGAIIMRGAALRACTDVDLKLVVVLVVRPDGTVENVTAEGETSEQTECISRVLLDARFPRSKGGRIRYPLQIEAPPRAKSHANCDTLRERAMQAFAMGQHAAALRDFEAAYACKPDDAGLRQTVVAACKARNMAKARQYWARMNEQQRGVVLAVCAHHGMFREQLDD